MENDKLKSIVLVVGSIVLLTLVATHPGLQKDAIWHPAAQPADTTVASAAPKTPDFAGIVSPNTSFFDLMRKCGVDAPSIKLIEKAVRNVYDFRRIYPGQRYEVYAAENGDIESMKFSVDDTSYIHINIKDGDISAERKDYEFSDNLRTASGTITSSLYKTIDDQGIPSEIGDKLANVFQWDIDFFRDMREGDYFKVIYEEKTRFDGLKKIGQIVAAEFYTQNRSHYAFLFKNGGGRADYYDEKGHSLRKQLLRAPLTFSRISSHFSYSRFHPVLHHYAPHLGVDYAAPIGTPVMAAGAGTVLAAERNPANGNYVKIRHTNSYITYYLHFSRFAKGIYPGAHVEQGQVIGYVGMTGYATGPHLDYRVMINNVFVNPQKVSLPPASPISNMNMASFIDLRDRHLARLESIGIGEGAATVASDEATTDDGPVPVRGESYSRVSH